jgi:hypothetical protein
VTKLGLDEVFGEATGTGCPAFAVGAPHKINAPTHAQTSAA